MALLVIFALVVGLFAGSAATASGGGVARAFNFKRCIKKAKKIEKKGKRKRAKRRCHKKKKKQKHQQQAQAPGPLVRATLTWDSQPPGGGGNIDLDLWVFDSSGNKARAAANTIPNATFSPNDVNAPGTETFTDLAYINPSGRNFSYGVCYQDGGSQHTVYKLDYVTADGAHHSASEEYGSDGASSSFNGGAPIPANFCKAP